MKRLLLLLSVFLLGMTLKSQETESSLLKVTSFEQLQSSMWKDNDLPEGMPKEDNNGKKWALIKISSKGVDADKFETIKIIHGDMQTAIGYQGISNGEVRVYVSSLKGAIRIKSYYGDLKYEFPYALQANKTYSMILELETATLTIRATPPEAKIYIDGEFAGTGSCSKVVSVGEEHHYKVTCDSYFDKTEVITLSKDDRNKEIDVALIANFGYIIVNSTPETGATVSIDGKNVGTTPYTSGRIDRGEHIVVISKEMYQAVTKMVNIVDNNPVELNVTMTANFAELTITTESGDEETGIYIDNVLKGKGFWKGRISPGNYIIEARKAGCEKTKKTVSLSNGENSVITLDNPIPNYGSLEVESNPSGATIRLNNIQKGVTPDTITNLPVGEYSLVLTKEGYGTAMQTVTVHKDRTEYVNLILENGKSITISSEPSGASVYVDGNYAGLTPTNTSISFGSHNVKVSLDGEEKTQSINVSEGGNSSWSFDVRKKPTGREISINSEPNGASVYVDSTYVGVTPINMSLNFGDHYVKVSKDGEENMQTINVSENGNSSWSFDVQKKSIGSLYTFSDGSKGIVFYLNSDGHGLVVSLDEAQNIMWSIPENISKIPDEKDYNTNLKVGLGATYTTYIINQLGRGQAPAAEWCRSKGNEWYLPSAGELWQLLCVANGKKGKSGAISTALKDNGGTKLSATYWSSSECNNNLAWLLWLGAKNRGIKRGDADVAIRAVRAF